ncbi:beta-N-acetylhexosaminidase [Granulicella paludicola]|uniref:beta-N-acetylhexosaminidase n=1 Tax=Granulicella paludicola TaxID=474951 RepID=UPI0021E0A0A3|nr:beta-N-acetylhexosaminidase [Granulicella paludicola]
MRKNALLAFAIALSAVRVSGQSTATDAFHNNLMPEPSSLTANTGSLSITNGLTVSATGASSPLLDHAIVRMISRLEDRTGLQLSKQIQTAPTATLVIDVRSAGPAVQSFEEDESYSLTSTANSIKIEAATPVGALHAMETLLQLVQASGSSYVIPSVTIQDSPRFRWRGLMIDCGRHFEPIEVLKRNIDAMAAVKLNVFHWHLTEDQGFRIESKRFPKLTEKGSDGLFYTQEQARDLVAYARERGIRVVPEFEMPGHSVAWLVAYPELNSGSQPTGIRREFGVSDYVLDPTHPETYKFIDSFLTEMTTIFPDEYIHIGGDEAPAPDWKKNPRILAFMKAHDLHDNDALQAYFNTQVLGILTKLHRRMAGWDEIFNPALPKDVVIQSWRGVASLAKGAQQGYEGILSAPYYIDGMQPAGKLYLADPVPADTTLTPEQQKLILGGEVPMWAEHLDQRTIDSRIWPRTAAIAERFWSPQNVRDVDDMYRRLDVVSVELETLGLRHLTSEDAELRALAGSENIAAMRDFASAFEPVSFGERSSTQHTTQLTPLTSFVDAVRPDPPIRHQIEVAAKTFLTAPTAQDPATNDAHQLLLHFFETVGASVPRVQLVMDRQPRFQPIHTRAEQLTELSVIGIDALKYLNTSTTPPAQWKEHSLAQIEAAKKPSGLVNFTFLPALTQLVNATR